MRGKKDMCLLSTVDAFTPTESWKNHISSTESPPPEKTIRVLKTKNNNIILGHLKRHGVFIQSQLVNRFTSEKC